MPEQHGVDEKSNNVKSVRKALLIMEELDKSGELSIGDLSERMCMDKATVHRLINTIKDAGYVNQNPDNKRYSNSLKLLAMGNRVMEKSGVKHIARPYVEELAGKTGETINLGILVGNKIIYVDKLESSSTIKVGLGIGVSVPSYCSGLGKAILAYTPEPERMEIINSITFEKFTDHSIVDSMLFMKELEKIRQNGYSVDDEEYVDGLICFGAPIFDFHGKPIAAISVSCPKYRYDEEKHLYFYTGLAAEAAKRISNRMGYKTD
jgi:DNA-binding IclR family transcriptional regulator